MLLLVEEGKNYCKSLFFVWKVIKDEIKLMVEVFRKVYRVLLFCESVEFNKFELCKLFEIFCFRLKEKNFEVLVLGFLSIVVLEMILVD